MDSSSGRNSAVTAAVLVQFVLLAAVATAVAPPPKFIDTVCQRVTDKAFCMKTLSEYPPATSAPALFPLTETVIGLAKAHAEKTLAFADQAAKTEPSAKAALAECHNAYLAILASFKSAAAELTSAPDTANYDVMVTVDQTRRVRELIGKNGDASSKTLAAMNDQMEKLIDLAAGATDSVDDDDENTFRRS